METLPYRFEFETDEQYEARTGVHLEEVQGTESTAPFSIVTTPPATTAARTGSFLILPWWMMVIIALILVIGFYESYRRRLTKILHEQHRALQTALPATPSSEPTPLPPKPPIVLDQPALQPPDVTPAMPPVDSTEPPKFLRQHLAEKAERPERPVPSPTKPTSLITRRHAARSPIRRRTAIKRVREAAAPAPPGPTSL